MPYHIEREGNKYNVVLDTSGKIVGSHPTKIQAQAQLGALYSNVKDVKKCMTCGCEDLGNDHHYISDTQKCSYCVTKGQGPCWDGYQYAGTKDQDGKTVPNCIPVKKENGTVNGNSSVNQGRISGGVGWSIEFNTQDCQHGWAVLKGGTGQSIGCYLTKEAAEEALRALAVTEPIINKTANPTPTKDSTSIWDGVFLPLGDATSGANFGSLDGDTGWLSTYNTPPQNDGKPSVGYGNSSSPKGSSNS